MGARLIHAAALVKVRANYLLTFAYFFCFYASRGVKERVSKITSVQNIGGIITKNVLKFLAKRNAYHKQIS
jgi:hypothetical protein